MVGIFVTVAVMAFGIVLYAKLFTSGMIGVEEYTLHSTFEKAFGLRTGTRVQISGVDVGQISNMEIESDGVRMEFVIKKQYQNWITDSATVFAIRDQNLISARVINIDVNHKGHVLQDGDYLPPGQAQDIETVLETANQLLGRVNELIDGVDTMLVMAMDTSTTIGALFGSRLLYDNLNIQLSRLDKITLSGKNMLIKTAGILDTLSYTVPSLMGKVDGIADDVTGLMGDIKPLPQKVDNLMGNVDTLMGNVGVMVGNVEKTLTKADNLVDEMGNLTSGLGDFMESTEQTLQNADDLMNGISNMWIIKRSMPDKDSVPFMVETLW